MTLGHNSHNSGIAVLGVLPETQNSIIGSTPSTSRGVVQITSMKGLTSQLLSELPLSTRGVSKGDHINETTTLLIQNIKTE